MSGEVRVQSVLEIYCIQASADHRSVTASFPTLKARKDALTYFNRVRVGFRRLRQCAWGT